MHKKSAGVGLWAKVFHLSFRFLDLEIPKKSTRKSSNSKAPQGFGKIIQEVENFV